ncbi:MAG: hypothetical protein ACREO7_12620, partial [Pseudoxanthomonas sp.]
MTLSASTEAFKASSTTLFPSAMTVKASTLTLFPWGASQKAPVLVLFCRIGRPGMRDADRRRSDVSRDYAQLK